MNAAKRMRTRASWPRGLYAPRPGYFVWRHPDGRTLPLGRVPLSHAIHEALAANAHIAATAPTLVDRLSGAVNTIAQVVEKMPATGAANTIKTRKFLDGAITAKLGKVPCYGLTVAMCAELIESRSKTARAAEAIRTRLVHICRRAQQLGWMDSNPAEITASPKVTVKRGRLTLDSFRAIYEAAPGVSAWLQRAMRYGLVLGADRLTISGLTRSNVGDELLTYRRQKTGAWIAVPLALRMDAVGWSLADLVAERTGVLSPYLLHHLTGQGQAAVGDPVHIDTISQAFTDARMLAGIADEGAPTFHELRSLCKRSYEAQGGVDTRGLLGHAGERVSDLYADPRGVEPVRVRLTK